MKNRVKLRNFEAIFNQKIFILGGLPLPIKSSFRMLELFANYFVKKDAFQ